ncbi:VrrA/YqfQ family protein [Aquibacillus rhizosphaerae]|uniref:VrrA/YqfQ family protein n=1 Tax=Aquibacillus rhizosphaerae TaxID=3051431 RepID=A0ABT7L540_9BACI|nr:VrrA/YqfQ family protein [Aquibacillus sp. LR5S19]MDL4839710.1 VrrA/YqfQ family protein [Aquibacillus sp. LR5S19]
MFSGPRGQSPFQQMPNPNAMRQSPFFGSGFGTPVPQQAPVAKGGIQGLLQKFMKPGAGASQGLVQGTAKGATSGGGITQTLANVQQVMKMAQSASPIIQQYGPMVKNLPSMLAMLKAFNEADDDEESDTDNELEDIDDDHETDNETNDKTKIDIKQENINKVETDYKKTKKVSSKKPKQSDGSSTPKLFI